MTNDTLTKVDGKSDASALTIFLDMEFTGKLRVSHVFDPITQIEQQLLYLDS